MVTNETKLSSALEEKLSKVLPDLDQLLKENGATEPFAVSLNIESSDSSLASATQDGTKTLTCIYDMAKRMWICS